MPTGPFFFSHRFRIYSNQSALESLAVSWEWGGGPGLGLRWAAKASPPSTGCPDFLPPPSQLIPLQAPLKTMLQIGVMPMLNGRVGGSEEGGGKDRGARGAQTELAVPTHRADLAWGADPTP